MTPSTPCDTCGQTADLNTEDWLFKCYWCDKEQPRKNTSMPKERLLTVLGNIKDNCDGEEGHILADRALLDFIADPEIEAAFSAIRRWYS